MRSLFPFLTIVSAIVLGLLLPLAFDLLKPLPAVRRALGGAVPEAR